MLQKAQLLTTISQMNTKLEQDFIIKGEELRAAKYNLQNLQSQLFTFRPIHIYIF